VFLLWNGAAGSDRFDFLLLGGSEGVGLGLVLLEQVLDFLLELLDLVFRDVGGAALEGVGVLVAVATGVAEGDLGLLGDLLAEGGELLAAVA